ncbi:MAG: nitroreductase family protein [Gammaproteobacteria bacterium]|nr:MAG: nitroreductase family protein [Gammaproteobacteria bacterium]
MWDFFETVRHRHSIRKYQADLPVEQEKLHAVLETACSAPSAGDLQSYRIVVVTDGGQRKALRKAAGDQEFVSEAPVCLIFCSDVKRAEAKYGERGKCLFAIQDATIAASYAQLAVVAAGMGSTWIGRFDEQAVIDIIQLDDGLTPVAMLSIGYPAELPELTPRRRLDDVVITPSQ